MASHGMVLPTQVHGQLDDLGRVQGHGAFDAEPGGAPGRTPGRTDLEGLVDRGVTAGQRIEAEGVRGGDRLPVAVDPPSGQGDGRDLRVHRRGDAVTYDAFEPFDRELRVSVHGPPSRSGCRAVPCWWGADTRTEGSHSHSIGSPREMLKPFSSS